MSMRTDPEEPGLEDGPSMTHSGTLRIFGLLILVVCLREAHLYLITCLTVIKSSYLVN